MKNYLAILCGLFLALTGCSEQQTSQTESVENVLNLDAGATPLYQCPMHPHFTSPHQDSECPICGMSLVSSEPIDHMDADDKAISVAPEMIQTMGVRTAKAHVVELGRTLRAFGTVETDEREENVIVSRLEGWLDGLQPRAEGDTVKRGSLLYRVYSPGLISAQKDFLNSQAIGNEKRIAAVRQRLASLGMQETAVRNLENTQEVLERVPVYAEAGGIVAQLDVKEGDYLEAGSPVLRLQSYSSVWVIARIPEQDLSLLANGLEAKLGFPSAAGAQITGAIDYIYPTIDAKTRTGKVRIEVDNKLGFLRPGA